MNCYLLRLLLTGQAKWTRAYSRKVIGLLQCLDCAIKGMTYGFRAHKTSDIAKPQSLHSALQRAPVHVKLSKLKAFLKNFLKSWASVLAETFGQTLGHCFLFPSAVSDLTVIQFDCGSSETLKSTIRSQIVLDLVTLAQFDIKPLIERSTRNTCFCLQ